MARGAAAGAVQEHPATDSQTPQLRPRPRGIPEPSRPGPGPPEPRCERTWQQNEKAGGGSWPLPLPPPHRSLRSAPHALGASCLQASWWPLNYFILGERWGRKGTPQPSRSGLWQRVEAAEKTWERVSPGLQRRVCGDEPAMERPPWGARSRLALRRRCRLSRGSRVLRSFGRPGWVSAAASGKDGSPAWRTLQQSLH